MRISIRQRVLSAVAVAMLALPGLAKLSGDCFNITTTSSMGTGTLSWGVDQMTYDPTDNSYYWGSYSPMDIKASDGTVLATLDSAWVDVYGDPSVSFAFFAHAGAVDTTFSVSSVLLSFPTINAAIGRASASFSLTDTNNNGAALTGLYGGGNAYLAQYNGFAGTQSGTTFTQLVPTYLAGAGQTQTQSANDPVLAYRAVGGNVSDMSSAVLFKLTARDLASGTNFYEVVPEPASFALVGIGLVGLLRIRKNPR